MQLVEPLTKLQLLEDIKGETASDESLAENTDTSPQSQKYTYTQACEVIK